MLETRKQAAKRRRGENDETERENLAPFVQNPKKRTRCGKCNKADDRGEEGMLQWIECSYCRIYYHRNCVKLGVHIESDDYYCCARCVEEE